MHEIKISTKKFQSPLHEKKNKKNKTEHKKIEYHTINQNEIFAIISILQRA